MYFKRKICSINHNAFHMHTILFTFTYALVALATRALCLLLRYVAHRTLTLINNRNRQANEEDECQTRISYSYHAGQATAQNIEWNRIKWWPGCCWKWSQADVQVKHLTSAEKLYSIITTFFAPSHTRSVICIQISVWRRLLNISFLNNLLALLIPSCTRLLASA